MLIHDYTVGEWGEEQAVKYVHALWDALEEVAATPGRGGCDPTFMKAAARGFARVTSSFTGCMRERCRLGAFFTVR